MDDDSETKRMLARADKEIENQGEVGQVDVSNPHHLHSRVTMPGGDDTTPPKRRAMSVSTIKFNGSEDHPARSTWVATSFNKSVNLPHSNSKSTQSQPGPYDRFKTRAGSFSGPLERQFSRVNSPHVPRTPDESVTIDEEQGGVKEGEQRQVVAEGDRNGRGDDDISTYRYFDAFEGPELEIIKVRLYHEEFTCLLLTSNLSRNCSEGSNSVIYAGAKGISCDYVCDKSCELMIGIC
jgi:hypothetical protein